MISHEKAIFLIIAVKATPIETLLLEVELKAKCEKCEINLLIDPSPKLNELKLN